MTDAEPVRPTYSVVVPIYDTDPVMFEEMVASVLAQSYPRWELVLCDDASPAPHVDAMLRAAAARDPRITVVRLDENGGIAAATNAAIAASSGDFVALLDHDDVLYPRALELMTVALEQEPDADYLYSDEDKITEAGQEWPFFKPGWSPDRMKVQMYTCHLGVFRRSIIDEVGGYREGFEAAQDWDLVLRVIERARKVVHVPHVLYSWRIHAGSTASSVEAKPHAIESQNRAVAEHLERTGFQAEVIRHPLHPENIALRPKLRSNPLVSIIMPTAGTVRRVRGEQVCLPIHALRSLVERSTYDNVEVLFVVDGHTPDHVVAEATALLGDRLRPLRWDQPFHYSRKCNLGLVHARGDHVLLLNDDVEVLTEDWIEQLLMFSEDPGVGAVGAKLLFDDGRIQHAGVTLTRECLPGHSMIGCSNADPGYALQSRIVVNTAAVTGACLMAKRSVLEEVGGLTDAFPNNYQDVDLCLKLLTAGYRNVQNNQVELFHFESMSRDGRVSEDEKHRFRQRWEGLLRGDPLYNPTFYPGVDFVAPWSSVTDKAVVDRRSPVG